MHVRTSVEYKNSTQTCLCSDSACCSVSPQGITDKYVLVGFTTAQPLCSRYILHTYKEKN